MTREVEAENVVITDSDFAVGQQEYRFRYRCMNCGIYHEGREISPREFSRIGYAHDCGQVRVVMPWAVSPARDHRASETCIHEKRFERWAEKGPRFKQWKEEIEERALAAINDERKACWMLTGIQENEGDVAL